MPGGTHAPIHYPRELFPAMDAHMVELWGPPGGPDAGRNVDRAALVETMRLARAGTHLWDECLRAGCARPSPWTGFDSFFHRAPIVAVRGTRECNAYYRMLRDELHAFMELFA